jgi:hypothetical protein
MVPRDYAMTIRLRLRSPAGTPVIIAVDAECLAHVDSTDRIGGIHEHAAFARFVDRASL